MRYLTLVLGMSAVSGQMLAQPGTVSTMVGAYPLGDGLPAGRASLIDLRSVAADTDGGLLIAEGNRIRRVGLDGRISTFLGNGTWGGPTPFPFAGTLKWRPGVDPLGLGRIAILPNGSVYTTVNFAGLCFENGTWIPAGSIVRFDRLDSISVALGTSPCSSRDFGDGIAAVNAFTSQVEYLAKDASGRLYFSDPQLNKVRRIDVDGKVATIAGSGVNGFEGDGGPAVRAALRRPNGLSVSPGGDLLLIADTENGRIRKVTAEGIVSTFAELPGVRFVILSKAGDVIASDGWSIWRISANGENRNQIFFPSPRGDIRDIAEDGDGSILVAHSVQVFRLNADGSDVGLVAGAEMATGSNGPLEFARTIYPQRTRFDSAGALWFLDWIGLRRQTERNTIERVSFGGVAFAFGPDSVVYVLNNDSLDRLVDGVRSRFIPAEKFMSTNLSDVAANAAGEIFIADRQNNKVWRIEPNGGDPKAVIGTGRAGNAGDGGPGESAELNAPESLAFGPDGSLYVGGQGAIRRLSPANRMTTIAGGATPCRPFEHAVALELGNCPFTSLAVDRRGEVYFTTQNFGIARVRGANAARIAGQPGLGNTGDGGPALQALFDYPRGFSFAPNGDLVVADLFNHRIRRIQGFAPFSFSPDRVIFAGSLGGPDLTDRIQVSSTDGETRSFRVQIIYPAGRQGWLRVSSARAQVGRDAAVGLDLTASPRGLPKGIYSARVRLTDTQSEDYAEFAVSLLVSGTAQQLRLAQTGFTFVASQGGPASPSQGLRVQNSGTGSLPFTVATSTLSGGAWLTVTPASGTADASAQPVIEVRTNPGNLAPGVYFGLVTVNSSVADNAPQSAVVLLQVLAAGESPSPIVDPAGLIFTSNAPQSITLGNARATASTYTISTPNFPDRVAWFQVGTTALTGNILPGQTAQIQIRPVIDGIPPGQYRAQLSIRFAPDNVTRVVELLLVIANAPTALAGKLNAAGACKPTKLLPIFRQPGGGFAATAGWPQLVQLRVVDDCQEPQTKGRVRISFNNGDPALTLTPQAEGVWTGTWSPGRVATRIDLSARAESFEPDLLGAQTVTGGLRDDANRPRIVPGGVFSEASLKKLDPVAVGSNITVQGVRMAANASAATTTPLPSRLGETTVLVAGKPLGLSNAAEGEIKGLIPFTVADATVQQMIVQRGASYSLPEPVLIAPVQPGVYTMDGSGRGQGEIYVRVEDQQVLVDAAQPALSGQDVTIIATGLGAVDPKVPDGAAGAADPVSNVLASLRVQIQGKEAAVKSATLAPGKPGRYQIVVTVPQDVAPDSSARVVLTLADQAVSSPVTMSVTRAVE